MTRPGRWQSTGVKPREARKHYAKTLPHPVPYPWPRTLWAAICLSCQELAICLSRASHSLCVSSSVPLPSLRLRHLQPGLLGQNQGFLLIHQPLRHPGVLISMCDSSFLFIFPLSLYSLLLLLLLWGGLKREKWLFFWFEAEHKLLPGFYLCAEWLLCRHASSRAVLGPT